MPQFLAQGVITELRAFAIPHTKEAESGFTMKVTSAHPVLVSPASFETKGASIRIGNKPTGFSALRVGETIDVAYYEFPASIPRIATQVVIMKSAVVKK